MSLLITKTVRANPKWKEPWMPADTTPHYFFGLDLGRDRDHSALCVLERKWRHVAVDADQLSVEQDVACPADPVLTPHVCPGEAEVISDEVREQETNGDGALDRGAVHGDGDLRRSTG